MTLLDADREGAAEEPAPRSSSPPPVLRCAGLRQRYGDRVAVDGLDFAIEAGEAFGLLGPNGAGKTTTISMVCGLLEPDAGTVAICGTPLHRRDHRVRRHLGYVPQDIALYHDLSATENLRFWGRLYGLRGRKLRRRVDEALDMVGLAERQRERVESYSGGMKRRLNIAAGLLHHPSLLVLDEPTVGVDPQSRNAILDGLEALRDGGMAILYTTHYMEEVERLCDRVGILDEGRMLAIGSRRELLATVGRQDQVTISASGRLDELVRASREVGGVNTADVTGDQVVLLVDDASAVLAPVLSTVHRIGVDVTGVEVEETNLETVFLHLTGKALRD